MAPRTSAIKFEFTGDAAAAQRAFAQVAAAAKASGGDLAKAGKQIEDALKKAGTSGPSLRENAIDRLVQSTAGIPGASELMDTFSEKIGGMSTKALAATAAVAGITTAAVAGGKALFNLWAGGVAEVDAVSDALGSNAEAASSVVGILRGVGVSAFTAAPALALLAKNVTTNASKLNDFGVVIARNANGGVDFEETLLNVAAAYQNTGDGAEKAQIGAAAFGRGWTEMVDVLESSLPVLERLRGTGPLVSDQDLANAKAMKSEFAQLRSEAGNVAGALFSKPAQLSIPILAEFRNRVEGVGDLITGDFSGAFDRAIARTHDADVGLTELSAAMVRAGGAALLAAANTRTLVDEVELASVRASGASAAFAKLLNTQTTSVSAQVRYKDALANLASTQAAGAQSAKRYQDAQNAIADATRSQARAVEDGAQRIADAEEQASRQVADAQKRVADARRAAADAAQDSADRVLDAERSLTDALSAGAGADNPLDQARQIEDARIALDRAKRDQAQGSLEGNRRIVDAEQEAVQAQQDGAKAVADARREAAQQQADAAQRVADAQGRANESYEVAAVSLGAMTSKVDDLVTSTFDAAFQTAAMGGSQEEVKKKVDDAKAALDLYGPALGLTTDQVIYYKKQLDLIPAAITTTIKIKWESASPIEAAKGLFGAGLAGAIAQAQAQQIKVPQFAGGGIFRTQAAGGAGLAVLHDGEKVVTPQQQAHGGNTFHIYGSVISDRDLADIISRAKRRGVQGL